MKRWMLCAMTFAFAVGLLGAADDKPAMKKEDEPKPSKSPEAKAPDWSKFAKAGEVSGEVHKASETAVTFRTKTRVQNGTRYMMKDVDTDYTWSEQGLARREKPPVFFDDKGLPRTAKSSEIEPLRKPMGVPGYAMERTDLKAGDIVKLEMVRPSSITAAKAKPEDLVIKYAIVVGEKKVAPEPKKK